MEIDTSDPLFLTVSIPSGLAGLAKGYFTATGQHIQPETLDKIISYGAPTATATLTTVLSAYDSYRFGHDITEAVIGTGIISVSATALSGLSMCTGFGIGYFAGTFMR